MRFQIIGPLLATSLVALAPSCSSPTSLGPGQDTGPHNFGSPDAGDSDAAEGGLVSYCPSDKCPADRTTCPSSRYPCDVDSKTDRDNCGACGVVCPTGGDREVFECLGGRCTLHCRMFPETTLDCDGVADNGCETDPGTNDNCAACGDTCTDPNRPCVNRMLLGTDYGCGCKGDDLYCPGPYPGCVDGTSDDSNCGACGNKCDPTGGGAPPYANTYYGCVKSQCGKPKCEGTWGNCDSSTSNGCETSLLTNENCGSCRNACGAGEECRLNRFLMPQCMCPAGRSYCESGRIGDTSVGDCYDLSADVQNCGGCGLRCGRGGAPDTCKFGMCALDCGTNRADCNGNPDDACEVEIGSDPRNCGGCGVACDAIAGQACISGRCVVEPCSEDAGSVGAR